MVSTEIQVETKKAAMDPIEKVESEARIIDVCNES